MTRSGGSSWLKNAYVLTAVAGFGLFAFSFVVLGLWPSRDASRTDFADTANRRLVRTASEQRGRQVYSREGCMNCHSQLVRFTDPRRPEVRAGEPGMGERRRFPPDVGDPAHRSGSRPRGWPKVTGLATRPSLESPVCRAGFGDARLPVVVRRLADPPAAWRSTW